MKNARINTDLRLNLSLKAGGASIDMTSIDVLSLYMYCNPQKARDGAIKHSVSTSGTKVLEMIWPADVQRYLGSHSVHGTIRYAGAVASFDIPAVNVVSLTSEADISTDTIVLEAPVGTEDLTATISIQGIGPKGPKGDKGDKMTYADLTQGDKEDLYEGGASLITPLLDTKQDALTDTDGGYGQRVAELEEKEIASQEKLSELDNKFADLKSILSEFTTLPVELQTGYYDRYHNTLQPSEAYKSAKINVISGEKYSISTKVNASTSLAMIIEFNGDATSGYVNAGTSSVQTFSDEMYIVPSGVTSIAVTSYLSEPIIKKEELEASLVSDVKDNASKVETLSVKIEELRKGELTKNLKNVLENGNFASTSKMTVFYATMSAANNILTCVGDGSNAKPLLVHNSVVSYTPDKKFAFLLRVRVTNDVCVKIRIEIAGGNGALEVVAPIKDKWYDVCVNHLAVTYTGNAFAVKFYYADAATANEKTGQIKDAVFFEYSEILGATYPVYKLMNIYKNNVWWNGSKDVIVDNFVSEDVINHSDNGYLLPCPNAYAATKRPIVTFINDDGWEDDYTKLVAISQKYNVPFVSALFDGSTIKDWYCLYLQNELGWEMASHPRNTALADLSTEEEIEQAIVETNEYLTSRGLKYHNLVYPYGSNDERVRRIAKKYYRCACTTDAGINTGVVGSFNLKRYPLGYGGSDSTNTLENLKAQVDACVANKGWLIFMLHPHMPEHTTALTETIASLIEYIQSIGVEIMTLNDGYNVHGNALECGDYTGGSSGIAIGFDGNMANM